MTDQAVTGQEYLAKVEGFESFRDRLQQDVDAYVEWTKEVWSELYKLRVDRKIHGSIAVPDLEYISNKYVPTGVIEFDESGVSFGGDEYWSYGGHEYHSYHIPIRWWTDREAYKAEEIAKRDDKLAHHQEMQAKNVENQAANRKALYEQLKKEFE